MLPGMEDDDRPIPTADEARLGLREIAKIRQTIRAARRPVNPFRHVHDGESKCPVCGLPVEPTVQLRAC